MSDSDDVFGEDAGAEEFADAFDRHRQAFLDRLDEFMDEEDLDEEYMGQLLLDALISLRMAAYGGGVEKPSVAGLKLDLDRLQKQVIEILREAKKGAEEFIATAREARAKAEAEGDDADAEEEEDDTK